MKITIKTAKLVLLSFREEHGITLEKVSKKTGVAISTLIAIESGKVKPQAITVFKINNFLKTFS